MILKTLNYKKMLTLVIILIAITTFITYYIKSNDSTVIPKSATLVQYKKTGDEIYE